MGGSAVFQDKDAHLPVCFIKSYMIGTFGGYGGKPSGQFVKHSVYSALHTPFAVIQKLGYRRIHHHNLPQDGF